MGRAGAAERKGKASSILYLKQVLTGMPQGGWKEKGVKEDSQHLVSSQRGSMRDGAHAPHFTNLISSNTPSRTLCSGPADLLGV